VRALVTGVAGFVGSTLARRLVDDGHEVRGIDRMSDYYDVRLKRENLASLGEDRIDFREQDIRTADLDELLAGVDVVFHQAGQPGVRASWGESFTEYSRDNVDATQTLLEAATRSSSIQRFVYASSSSVYGDAERYPTVESDLPRPVSPYGVTKLAGEHLTKLYARNFGLPTVALRYFTVYGPRQRPDMAFSRFVRAAIDDDVITVYGTGAQIRDFTFVTDVVEANIRAAMVDSASGSVFNVSGGSSVSVTEVLETLGHIRGSALRINHEAEAVGDVRQTGGSTDAISAALGWQAQVSLDDGLRRQYEWALERTPAGLRTPRH
jgi:UDP-glucuronate 4-epimerase